MCIRDSPGYLAFQLDGYDDVFGDLMDSERARLLEGVNRILEEMIGRGSGFLRRVGSGGRYIAVVEERQLEQFANRGYDVLDKIRALDPSAVSYTHLARYPGRLALYSASMRRSSVSSFSTSRVMLSASPGTVELCTLQ